MYYTHPSDNITQIIWTYFTKVEKTIQSDKLYWMNHWFSAASSRMPRLKATCLDDISCVSLRQWWSVVHCGGFVTQLLQRLLSSVHAEQCISDFRHSGSESCPSGDYWTGVHRLTFNAAHVLCSYFKKRLLVMKVKDEFNYHPVRFCH